MKRIPLLAFILSVSLCAAEPPGKINVHWDKVTRVSKTTATLQVVVNPPLRRGSKIHDRVFQALHNLQASYVRYVPWLPYPKLGVAELEPPANGKTSWNFSLIDPMTVDFLNATKGHPVVLNFSTTPQWMWVTPEPVPYPADPDQVTWRYEQGTQLRDPTVKQLGDYYARLVSWYTKGGFVDELGKRHESGHHFKVDYWEVLNEVESEHHMDPKFYTAVYDGIVSAIRKVDPQMKFVGMALGGPSTHPDFPEYFLNHRNHKAGIPLDMISYHFYAVPTPDQSMDVQQFTFFAKAEGFLNTVRYIEAIRKRLSPETGTMINEIGSISAGDTQQGKPGYVFKGIPNAYWNLSGAMYAYLYAKLANLGIDVAGESQLVGYPTQYPSVSMVDWNTGQPNARFWVLKLLRDNFGPGDKLIDTSQPSHSVFAQAFVTRDGKRKVLLVNKRNRSFTFTLPGAAGGAKETVDQTTAFHPPVSSNLSSDTVNLPGFAVTVVTLK